MKKHKLKVELIEDFRISHNMTIKEFCDACNISTYLYKKLLSGGTIRITPYFNILVFTNLSSDELFDLK